MSSVTIFAAVRDKLTIVDQQKGTHMRTKIKQQVHWFFQDPTRTWAFAMTVLMGAAVIATEIDARREERRYG